MTNSNNGLEKNQEEIELLMLAYSDLIQINNGEIKVKLPADIEVIFTLPDGYPTVSSPKHNIIVPAYLSEIRQKINDTLMSNYETYAGYQLLTACIGEINRIANDHQHASSQEYSGFSEEHFDPESSQEARSQIERPTGKRFNWISGGILEDRKSRFQAHLVKIESREEAMLALTQLKGNNKIARATHNIYAYLSNVDGREQSDCEDDGEKGAGPKLMHMLKIMKIENMMVVVSRWYGGIHLSTDRFKHICNVARELIVEHQKLN